MARTTSYVLDPEDLSFAKEFVVKRVHRAGGLGDERVLAQAFDGMGMVVQKQKAGHLAPKRAVNQFAKHLQTFNEHERFSGIVAKLRNGIRVRRYRKTHGSRKASDKTITINHESWALLKTVIKHGGAKTLSEAILNLDMPDDVLEQMRSSQSQRKQVPRR